MKAVYFDNAATSPMSSEVLQAMSAAYADVAGNPSSLHLFGQKAKRALDQSRQAVARAYPGAFCARITPFGDRQDRLHPGGLVP